MQRIRNDTWKEDVNLKQTLIDFVRRQYKRSEVLGIIQKRFPQYAWSICTLANRLKFFDIKYIDYNLEIENVHNAVSNELQGPGCKLGYRAMTRKIREVHQLNVPRDVVYNLMKDIDPEGLERRGGVGESKRRKRNKRFISPVGGFFI